MIHAGVIRNLKSHRNQAGARTMTPPGVLEALPEEPDDLYEALSWFAQSGVDVVVIDGGDGTVRDVLSRAGRAYGDKLPRFAIIPHGKTNALALDLGMRLGTPMEAVLAAAKTGGRTKTRACLEVIRAGQNEPELRGFLFGMGGFVQATEHAQKTHDVGFFHNAAIAATVVGAGFHILTGKDDDLWRKGEEASLSIDGGEAEHRHWFTILAATLKRFPMGLKPFGTPHEGLKILAAEAPPRSFWRALPAVLRGSEGAWLERAGYRRYDCVSADISCVDGFVLDGEVYSGGDLTVRQGPDLEFVMA